MSSSDESDTSLDISSDSRYTTPYSLEEEVFVKEEVVMEEEVVDEVVVKEEYAEAGRGERMRSALERFGAPVDPEMADSDSSLTDFYKVTPPAKRRIVTCEECGVRYNGRRQSRHSCFQQEEYEFPYCDHTSLRREHMTAHMLHVHTLPKMCCLEPGCMAEPAMSLKSLRKHWGRKDGGHSSFFSVKAVITLCGSCGSRNATTCPCVLGEPVLVAGNLQDALAKAIGVPVQFL